MGNRAIVAFGSAVDSPGIYLHWNGGRASVEGFLQAARELGLRRVDTSSQADMLAAADKLAAMIARHFFGTSPGPGGSVRAEFFGNGDVEDNGAYVVGSNMQIIARHFKRRAEEVDAAKTADIVQNILSSAPAFND